LCKPSTRIEFDRSDCKVYIHFLESPQHAQRRCSGTQSPSYGRFGLLCLAGILLAAFGQLGHKFSAKSKGLLYGVMLELDTCCTGQQLSFITTPLVLAKVNEAKRREIRGITKGSFNCDLVGKKMILADSHPLSQHSRSLD
jgi:hypothetical protein